jgi:hypothetical protein
MLAIRSILNEEYDVLQNLIRQVDVGLLVDWTADLHLSLFRDESVEEKVCSGCLLGLMVHVMNYEAE